MLCETFKHSPVFMIGGDEFVAILTGRDYENRKALVDQLKQDYEDAYDQTGESPWLRYSAAVGMADKAFEDSTAEFVFRRADQEMYKDKGRIKHIHGERSR